MNPIEERVEDTEEEIMEQIVDSYGVGPEREFETDEEEIVLPKVKCLKLFWLYRRYAFTRTSRLKETLLLFVHLIDKNVSLNPKHY